MVGGFGDRDSLIFSGNVSQRVGYSAELNSASARSGAGYATGAHGNYNFNVDSYSDNGNGQWFYGQFFPR